MNHVEHADISLNVHGNKVDKLTKWFLRKLSFFTDQIPIRFYLEARLLRLIKWCIVGLFIFRTHIEMDSSWF